MVDQPDSDTMGYRAAVPDGSVDALADHYRVADLLARYCHAVDTTNLDAVCALLVNTDVDFRGRRVAGHEIRDLYTATFTDSPPTAHCFTNLVVTPWVQGSAPEVGTNRQVSYRATYQRYHLGEGQTSLAAVGFYQGTVALSADGQHWLTHQVRTSAAS